MSDTRKLMDGEVLVLDRRPHLLYFSSQMLTAAGLLAGLILWARLSGFLHTGLGWILTLAAAIWAGWTALRLLGWFMTHFQVTNRRVIWRTGVLARSGVEIPLDRINNVNFHQSIIERLFGAGDLVIESAGRDGRSRFSDVQHPDAVQLVIHEQAGRPSSQQVVIGDPASAADDRVSGPELADALERLSTMHARGLLTDEEFRLAKQRLLD